MAIELGRFIADQLARLPEDHPDRAFITGLGAAVDAYADLTADEQLAPVPTVDVQAEPVPAATAEPEPPAEHARLRINGRLGAAPTFRVTPKGQQRIATFPLAEQTPANETTWHRVVAFNKPGRPAADRVEALGLAKGSPVEVIGYRHEREVRARSVDTRELTPRTVVEIYAVSVRKK